MNPLPAHESAKRAVDDVKDGARALAALGRLELQVFEERVHDRVTSLGRKCGRLAGVALAAAFSAAWLSMGLLHWLELRVEQWQAYAIVGALWGALAFGLSRMPGGSETVSHADPAPATEPAASPAEQIESEQHRLENDVASFKREASVWFGLKPRVARWTPVGIAAGLSAIVLLAYRPSRRSRS